MRTHILHALLLLSVAAHAATLSRISCQHSSFTAPGTDACSVYLTAVNTGTTSVKVALTSTPGITLNSNTAWILPGRLSAGFTATVTTSGTITATLHGVTRTYAITLTAPVQHKVSLSWQAPIPNGDDVIGFHVYRGGSYIATVDPLSYTDSNVTSGKTYTYTVRSIDANGIESVDSNILTVTIP